MTRPMFKGEILEPFLQGLYKTEIRSTDFTETFTSLKSRKVHLYFCYYKK